MSDPFIGEIRMFGGTYAPRGWATCDGQLLNIRDNTPLYSLLGTNFGGNGTTTFGLPDLRSRAPMHTTAYKSSPFGSYPIGASGGSSTVTLNTTQMASHRHDLMAAGLPATSNAPGSNMTLTRTGGGLAYQANATNLVAMGTGATDFVGGGAAHNNIQPYQTLIFIIALQGIYPPRN